MSDTEGFVLTSSSRLTDMMSDVDLSEGVPFFCFSSTEDALLHEIVKGRRAERQHWKSSGVKRGVVRAPSDTHWAAARRKNGWKRKDPSRPCLPVLPTFHTGIGVFVDHQVTYDPANVSSVVKTLGTILSSDSFTMSDLDSFLYVMNREPYRQALAKVPELAGRYKAQAEIYRGQVEEHLSRAEERDLELLSSSISEYRRNNAEQDFEDFGRRAAEVSAKVDARLSKRRTALEVKLGYSLDFVDALHRADTPFNFYFEVNEDPYLYEGSELRNALSHHKDHAKILIEHDGNYRHDFKKVPGLDDRMQALLREARDAEFSVKLNPDEYVYLFEIARELKAKHGDQHEKSVYLDSFLITNYHSEKLGFFGELLVIDVDGDDVVERRYAGTNNNLDEPQFQDYKLARGARKRKKKTHQRAGQEVAKISGTRVSWLKKVPEDSPRKLATYLFRAGYKRAQIHHLFTEPSNSMWRDTEDHWHDHKVLHYIKNLSDRTRHTDHKDLSQRQLTADGMWEFLKPGHKAFVQGTFNDWYTARKTE